MAEYEIETLYRDSRINRIFEGTNEINRILIATTLLKNHVEPSEEEELEIGLLQREKQVLQLMKKLFHAAIESIKKNFLSDLNKEQEIAAFLAALVIGIYGIESAVLRTEKSILNTGEEKNRQKLDCTRVYTHEASQKLALTALNMINHFGDEGIFSRIASLLIMSSSENIVLVKRRIASIWERL